MYGRVGIPFPLPTPAPHHPHLHTRGVTTLIKSRISSRISYYVLTWMWDSKKLKTYHERALKIVRGDCTTHFQGRPKRDTSIFM